MEHLLKQQWDISLNCVSLAKIRELDNNKFSFAVQSLSHVQLFVTPWTVARQASLPFTISQSLLKLMSIESVMLSSHFVLYHPFSFCLWSFLAFGSMDHLKKEKVCYVLTLASSFLVCFCFIDWADPSKNLSGNLLWRMDVPLSSQEGWGFHILG